LNNNEGFAYGELNDDNNCFGKFKFHCVDIVERNYYNYNPRLRALFVLYRIVFIFKRKHKDVNC